MTLYIATRTEYNRTAIWPPFSSLERAKEMIASHVKFRIDEEGSTLQRQIENEPAPVKPGTQVRVGGNDGSPVLKDAPECINCSVHETELINKDGERCLYRVIQTFVQE